MKCKDCIHNEVCHMREVCNNIEEQVKELGCMDFISRSDVQEIKHGEWEKYYPENEFENKHEGLYHCSICGHGVDVVDGTITPLDRGINYCPDCGAKMDGGNNNA